MSARIEGGELVFSTAADDGGEAARQMLVLPARRYALEATARVKGAEAPPYLRLVCLPGGPELLRQPLAGRGTSRAVFSVPAGCRAQSLSLVILPASGLGSVSGVLGEVRLAPIG